ncbi:MAG: relaxase/mobilization nuclease domain-containing protein [Oscillospiraceae bacterium]|nr:relaxase/mobilization nuclease domain-containing protein [Oscillospiraceae bacterium]
MATTSIWRVKGWLGKLVVYVENPDKTENPAFYEKPDMTDRQAQGLSDVIDYAVNQEKTEKIEADDEGAPVMQQFVSGVNCTPTTARDEMISVKKRFGKDGGVIAYHGYQSFAPGEATPEIAHEIGLKLAAALWGEKYQVLLATHLDKDSHLHNHFVVNTVSFVDGIRYHRTEKDYYDMQKESDRLCREYGLSVIENPGRGKSKHYGEWRAEQEQRPTWRGLIKNDVDTAIRQSMTERQFFHVLKEMGYEIKTGKDISVKPQGKERFMRLTRNFGEDYSIEGIRRRILAQSRPERPMREQRPEPKRYRLNGDLKKTRKITGFRALYLHYCYLLGVFPKNRPPSPKRTHFLYREDLLKAEALSKEARLLSAHKIDTAEQLTAYQSGVDSEIGEVTERRKQLYRKLRTKPVMQDEAKQAEIKAQIAGLTGQLKTLRQEVKLCEDIAVRSGMMKEKTKTVREDEKSSRKEMQKDGKFRRRG